MKAYKRGKYYIIKFMINIITYDNVNNKIYSRMNLIEKHAKKYICGRLVYNFLIFSEIDKALDFNEYVSANIVLNPVCTA